MNTQQLRQKILDLAIRGQLVPQDEKDEPAQVLLEKIRTEKEKNLPKKGKKKSVDTDKSPYQNEEEFPFQIPENWAWCKLGDLGLYKKGPFGSSITKAMFVPKSENTFKVYEQKNAINKNEKLGHYYISEEKFQELKNFEVFPNDIIVSCAGTIGETFILPDDIEKGIINQALMKVSLFLKEISPFYLIYFDFILKKEAESLGKGIAIKNIPRFDVLKNFLFPLPPLPEQHRIVSKIEEIFALIDTIEQNQSDLKTTIEQTKAKVLDMAIRGKLLSMIDNKKTFDNKHYTDEEFPFEIPKHWQWKKLGEVGEKIETGNSINVKEKEEKYNKIEQGFDYIGTKDIINYNTIIYDNGVKIPFDTKFKIAKKHSVLLCIEGGSAGRKLSITDKDVCYGNKLAKFYSEQNNIFYILYFLMSFEFKKQFNENLSGLIGGVGVNKLNEFLIPLPPLEEQQKIVQKIEKIFAELDFIEQNI